jgi:SMI1-KNR4 cell-wall
MDILKHLTTLGAKSRPIAPEGAAYTIETVEDRLLISLPSALKEILARYGSGIIFEKGVLFRPITSSGWEGSDGALDVIAIYGLSYDEQGLLKQNSIYESQVPPSCIVFAESSGGNQICLDRDSGHVLFWDHEADGRDDPISLISSSFDSFIAQLYAGEDTLGSLDGIVASKSFLDF